MLSDLIRRIIEALKRIFGRKKLASLGLGAGRVEPKPEPDKGAPNLFEAAARTLDLLAGEDNLCVICGQPIAVLQGLKITAAHARCADRFYLPSSSSRISSR